MKGERDDPETETAARYGGPITRLKREDMPNDTRKNKPSRPSGNARKSGTVGRKTPERVSLDHTAQERERMQTGLRILARIIARGHLSRQASGARRRHQSRRRTWEMATERQPEPAQRLKKAVRLPPWPRDNGVRGTRHTTKLVPKQFLARHYKRTISPGQWSIGALPREERA